MLFSFSHDSLKSEEYMLFEYKFTRKFSLFVYYKQSTKHKGSTTGHSAPTSSSKTPPGDVRPGHIMFAPAKTNLIAPRSTCNFFIISGSVKLKTIV